MLDSEDQDSPEQTDSGPKTAELSLAQQAGIEFVFREKERIAAITALEIAKNGGTPEPEEYNGKY